MRIATLLSLLLIASAISLAIGGVFLYVYDLVPTFLVETTLVAVALLIVLSFFVLRGNKLSINISPILGVVAPVMSYLTPAHMGVLEQMSSGG